MSHKVQNCIGFKHVHLVWLRRMAHEPSSPP